LGAQTNPRIRFYRSQEPGYARFLSPVETHLQPSGKSAVKIRGRIGSLVQKHEGKVRVKVKKKGENTSANSATFCKTRIGVLTANER
jgi:hypothetical protein